MAERGAPRLAYWGPALPPDLDLSALAPLVAAPVPQGILDDGEALCWLPEAGQGFTGHPALAAHRDGRELVTQLAVGEVRRSDGGVTFELADEAAEVGLLLSLALDPATGVLASRATIVNQGSTLTLDWLAAAAFETAYDEVLSFGGRWGREFQESRQRIDSGVLMRENRTGRTSHHAPPFLVIGEAGFGQDRGETFGLHLAWSGNHRMLVERLRDGRIQVQAGEALSPGEVRLQRGEAYESPWLYAARGATGLNGLSARLHPFVRNVILGGRLEGRPRPVNYNTWEAVYFDHDVGTLKGLVDLAADVGAERFVLDDGWFRGRPDDRSGLGDWTPDPKKYPEGLTPLIDHVRSRGLTFGLWVEPEMANAQSDLLRAHPDWVLGAPGRDQPLGRRQFVLDLGRPEVSEALFAQLDRLLSENAISYLKWDMNRDLTHAVSDGAGAVRRQTLAVYALIDRLRAAHPAVEIESCASGGARADYEILKRTDRIWTSDCNDPVERQSIQRAFSIFLPPEVMGAHVGPAESHTTARTTSLEMRAFTALVGHFGIEADLRAFSPEERRALSEVIALYKRVREWAHGGQVLRLTDPDPGRLIHVLKGADRALVTVAQTATPQQAGPAPVGLAFVEPDKLYRVRLVNPPVRYGAAMKRRTPLVRGEPITASGALLASAGLRAPILRAGEIAVFEIEKLS
jgi:alpha-galactosidase